MVLMTRALLASNPGDRSRSGTFLRERARLLFCSATCFGPKTLLWLLPSSGLTLANVALELAASLGGSQTTTLDGLGRPSIRGRRTRAGTPENVCAQALIEAWYRVDPSDRRLWDSPLQ